MPPMMSVSTRRWWNDEASFCAQGRKGGGVVGVAAAAVPPPLHGEAAATATAVLPHLIDGDGDDAPSSLGLAWTHASIMVDIRSSLTAGSAAAAPSVTAHLPAPLPEASPSPSPPRPRPAPHEKGGTSVQAIGRQTYGFIAPEPAAFTVSSSSSQKLPLREFMAMNPTPTGSEAPAWGVTGAPAPCSRGISSSILNGGQSMVPDDTHHQGQGQGMRIGPSARPKRADPPPPPPPRASTSSAAAPASSSSRVVWLDEVSLGDYVLVAPLAAPPYLNPGGPSDGSSSSSSQREGFITDILINDEMQPEGILVRLHCETIGHVIRLIAPRGPRAAEAARAATKEEAERRRRQKEEEEKHELVGRRRQQGQEGEKSADIKREMEVVRSGETPPDWQCFVDQYGVALTWAILEDCEGDQEEAIKVFQTQFDLLEHGSLDALDTLIAHAVDRAKGLGEAAVEAELAEEEEKSRKRAQAAATAAAAASSIGRGAGSRMRDAGRGGGRRGSGGRGGAAREEAIIPPPTLMMQRPVAGHGPGFASTSGSGAVPGGMEGGGGLGLPPPRESVGPVYRPSEADQPSSSRTRPIGGGAMTTAAAAAEGRQRRGVGGSAGVGPGGASAALGLPPPRLLKRPDNLAQSAAKVGVSIKSAEFLRALLPGYSVDLVISALVDAKGDANVAADRLLISGPPLDEGGEAEAAMTEAAEALSLEEEGGEVVAAAEGARSTEAPSSAPSSLPPPPTPLDPGVFTLIDPSSSLASSSSMTEAEKVQYLVASFEGLDPGLASFLLVQQCHSDLAAAVRLISEEVLLGGGRIGGGGGGGAIEENKPSAPPSSARPPAPFTDIWQDEVEGYDIGFTSLDLAPPLPLPARPPPRSPAGVASTSSCQAGGVSNRGSSNPDMHRSKSGPSLALFPLVPTPASQGIAWKEVAVAGKVPSSTSSVTINGNRSKGLERVEPSTAALAASPAADAPYPYSPGQRRSGSAKDDLRYKSRLESEQARQVSQVYYDARNVYFRKAASAYASGDGRLAAELSRKGKEMGALAMKQRERANEAAFRASNLAVQNEFVVDLHHLFVEEALTILRRTLATLVALDQAAASSSSSGSQLVVKVITGIGRHSLHGKPVIKEAVLAFLTEKAFVFNIDPRNEGVVCVRLNNNNQKDKLQRR